jgi:hypothetical protein
MRVLWFSRSRWPRERRFCAKNLQGDIEERRTILCSSFHFCVWPAGPPQRVSRRRRCLQLADEYFWRCWIYYMGLHWLVAYRLHACARSSRHFSRQSTIQGFWAALFHLVRHRLQRHYCHHPRVPSIYALERLGLFRGIYQPDIVHRAVRRPQMPDSMSLCQAGRCQPRHRLMRGYRASYTRTEADNLVPAPLSIDRDVKLRRTSLKSQPPRYSTATTSTWTEILPDT